MKRKVKDNHPDVRARGNLLLVSLVMFLVVHADPGWGQDNFGAANRGPHPDSQPIVSNRQLQRGRIGEF